MTRLVRGFAAVLAGLCLGAGPAAARELTFEERVAAQAAVERVYYAHQEGATVPFEQAVSRDALEKKVRDYLEKSASLETLGHVVMTPAMLREESARMTTSSVMPERLREIRAALGNDPILFEECAARPSLADRLVRALLDPAATIPLERPDGEAARERSVRTGESVCLPDDTWSNGSLASGTPLGSRFAYTSLWTGSLMIVWGGWFTQGGLSPATNTGGMYDPALDTWRLMSTTGAPRGRSEATAVWTGTEMIVWGGYEPSPGFWFNSGGRYNPSTDTWTPLSTTGAPQARSGHVAVWTGTQMIVWAGRISALGPTYTSTGGRYDPVLDAWTPTSVSGAPAAGLYVGFWTGQRMVVWRGENGTGGRYDPESDTWLPTSTTNVPSSRSIYNAVWTGSSMIVFGGRGPGGATVTLNTGGRYDPVSDLWTATSTSNARPRESSAVAWTGHEMLAWGGYDTHVGLVQTGDRYDPASDSWAPMSDVNRPATSFSLTGLWTGSFMIVFNGSTGGRYALRHAIDDDGDGFSECDGDCNDGNAAIHPGAAEVCNGLDNNCDGIVDFDADGDGFLACRGDCDDTNPTIHPGAVDICDGLDNDCNGFVDDAVEVCDGVDNDCDGLIDEDILATPPIQGFAFTSETAFAWQPYAYGAQGSDVVKGSLAALRAGGGDFTSSLLTCLANDTTSGTATDPALTTPGQGFYYLIRSGQCGLIGTYDEGAASQRGSRDAPIAASTEACP